MTREGFLVGDGEKKEEEKFVEARKAKSEEVSRRRLRLWNRACVLEDDRSDREEKNIGRYLWVLFRKVAL